MQDQIKVYKEQELRVFLGDGRLQHTLTIIQPPHKKKVLPPVANPIEQGCNMTIFSKWQGEQKGKISTDNVQS